MRLWCPSVLFGVVFVQHIVSNTVALHAQTMVRLIESKYSTPDYFHTRHMMHMLNMCMLLMFYIHNMLFLIDSMNSTKFDAKYIHIMQE